MKKSKHIAFYILFPILTALLIVLNLLIFDVLNGPLVFFVLSWIFIAGFIASSIILMNRRIWWRLIPYGGLILSLTLCINLSSTPEIRKPAVSYDNPIKTEILSIPNGDIQGVYSYDQKVEIYAGIPYAKAPIGDLRWKEPQEVENWEGVRDCSYFAPRSMQTRDSNFVNFAQDIYCEKTWRPDYNCYPQQERSEDSLYLNVWKPAGNVANLPVLVYIHGGSLSSGSSATDDYNGESMAHKGIIMITITYRLGIFGYFAHEDLINESANHTTGNYGLLDQIQALKWINNNIAYFGGDKNNITIAGESAGSSSVSALCTSPLSAGLFKRAIGESSSLVVEKAPHTFRDMSDALEVGKDIMKDLGVSTIEQMRKLSADTLVEYSSLNQGMTVDGYALTKTPYESYLAKENHEEALLNGSNVKEAYAFTVVQYLFEGQPNLSNFKSRLETVFGSEHTNQIYDLYTPSNDDEAFVIFNDIISCWWFTYPHQMWSTMALNNDEDVYRYYFTKENGYYGTNHFGEVIYAYGNIRKAPKTYRYDELDYKLSDDMANYWANFVKNGNPNGEGLLTWPKYNLSDNQVFELGEHIGNIDYPYAGLYPIFTDFIHRGGLEGIYGK